MALKFLRIAKLIVGNKIVDPDTGAPTTAFMRAINDSFGNIESAVNSIKQQTDDIQFSLQQAGIALTSATEAHAIAVAAGKEAALVNSYVDPSAVLSAALATDPTKATITIANHSRKYGDGTSVAVTGGTITGLALNTTYFITYLDTARAGGAVTYLYTTVGTDAGQGLGKHLVGTITTPASSTGTGSGPTQGGATPPPGVPYRYDGNYPEQ